MNEQKPEMIEKPEELLRVEKLIDDAKVNEAHKLLDNFEKKEGLSLNDKVTSHIVRADLLFQQGRYEKVITLTEQILKESLKLGKNLQTVDCLILMAESLWASGKFDNLFDIIIQSEEILKNLTQVLSSRLMKRKAYLAFLKGITYGATGEINLFNKGLKQSLDLAEKTDFKRLNATILRILAFFAINIRGDLDQAFAYIKKGLAIAKESKNKYTIANCLRTLGEVHSRTGDWEYTLKIFSECISIYEELENRIDKSIVLNLMANIYRDFTLDYDRATEYVDASLAVHEEDVGVLAGSRFYTALTIALKKGDYEGAKKYLKNLEQMNNQVKDNYIDLLDSRYRIGRALLLKSSSRFHDMGKAEKILRQILTKEAFTFEFITVALVNLCDILLAEFRVTHNLEILNELEPLITQLLTIGEKSQSRRIQVETYLFQAKLALLSFDVKKSRRFLTQAQQIAERHNLNKLAKEISSEHKNLIDRIELWEQLKDSEAPLSERFELAQISEHMTRMHRNLAVATQIIEEKVVITKEMKICLVCKGKVFGFSYNCKCGANYCENCARALSNLENVCWACNVPIDYSKPSKPFNEEEEPIKVQEKAKKK